MRKDQNLGEYLRMQGVSRRGFLKFCSATASLMALCRHRPFRRLPKRWLRPGARRLSGCRSRNAPVAPSR